MLNVNAQITRQNAKQLLYLFPIVMLFRYKCKK